VEWRTLKRVASIRVSSVDKKSVDGQQPVRLCNYTDVYYRDSIQCDQDFMQATATKDQIETFRVRAGDVVITKDSETPDDIGVPALVVNTAPDLVCGYHLAIIRPDPAAMDGRFLFRAMASAPLREQMAVAATGVTRFGLRTDSLAGLMVPSPDIRKQRAIADFLDAETARIDALIAKKRRLQNVLRDRAITLVESHVLGLSRASTVADKSGWFTHVPAGWDETQLRHLGCDVQTGPFGSQLHAEDYVEGGWPVVNPANLSSGRIRPIPSMAISDEKRAELARHILQPGDIVFGRRGELGRAGLVGPGESGWVCGTGSLRLRLKGRGLLPTYVKVLLETRALRNYLSIMSIGSTMDNLNSDILLSAPTLVPPISEQSRIVNRVNQLYGDTSKLSETLDRQIELLREHRQALITAAVTGEIDVHGGGDGQDERGAVRVGDL
jgi:type I restriction enzyme S subunit